MTIGGVTAILTALAGLLAAAATWAAFLQRRSRSESYRLRGIERRYLAAREWIFQAQSWASDRGLLRELPRLPKLLTEDADQEELERYIQTRLAEAKTYGNPDPIN